jgi:hypothetical protein
MMSGFFAQLSRVGKAAVVIGGLGYASSFLLVFPALYGAIFRPSAENQQPYEPPGDSDHGNLKVMSRRLRGWPSASKNDDGPECWRGMALWKDRAPLVRGRGPSNGSKVTHWLTETVDHEVYFGRYTFDLAYLVEPGTGAIGFSHVAQEGENTRLIERIPPPPPGPPGWHAIQPGRCVFAKEEPADADGTIGRFLIDLPGQALIRIESELSRNELGPTFERLSFNDKEAAREPIPGAEMGGFRYRTGQAGRYAVTIHRPTDSQHDGMERKERIRYSLMVVWGETGFTRSCTSPRDDLDCLGEKDDD